MTPNLPSSSATQHLQPQHQVNAPPTTHSLSGKHQPLSNTGGAAASAMAASLDAFSGLSGAGRGQQTSPRPMMGGGIPRPGGPMMHGQGGPMPQQPFLNIPRGSPQTNSNIRKGAGF